MKMLLISLCSAVVLFSIAACDEIIVPAPAASDSGSRSIGLAGQDAGPTDARSSPQEPSPCQEYCSLTTALCKGENAIFPDRGGCLDACSRLDTSGQPDDRYGNTVQCRIYWLHSSEFGVDRPGDTCPRSSVQSTLDSCGGS